MRENKSKRKFKIFRTTGLITNENKKNQCT